MRRGDILFLVIVLALGAALRVVLLGRSSWMVEGDEAVVGLMANHILAGERPIFFAGQQYAGAYQSYAAALVFAVAGMSRWGLKLVPLVASLGVVVTTYWLARRMLPESSARVAAVVATVPPIYVAANMLKALSAYTEVIVLGNLCLTLAIGLGWRKAARSRTALWLGLLAGFAFWLQPIAIYYIATFALVIALRLGRRLLGLLPVLSAGALVGATPLWIGNLTEGFGTFRYLLQGGGARPDAGEVWDYTVHNTLPRVFGLNQPWGDTPEAMSWVLGGLLVVGAAALAAWGRSDGGQDGPRPVHMPSGVSTLWQRDSGFAPMPLPGGKASSHASSPSGRGLGEGTEVWLAPSHVPLIFLAVSVALFLASGFGGPALNPWGFDATGRYLVPLWSAVPLCVAALWGWVARRSTVLAIALVAIILGIHLFGWAASAPERVFQSPYWGKLPLSSEALIAYLRAEGISRVWMNHWAGFPLSFDSGESIVAADYYDVHAGGPNRFPEYIEVVERAERPAYVLVTDEAVPALETRLRGMGVEFGKARVGPYVVIRPLSRAVHPSEVLDAIDYRY